MNNISDLLNNSIHRIAVAGHLHPDGDCAGSVLALYYYFIRNFGNIEVVPFLDLPFSDDIRFLLEDAPVRCDDGDGEYFDLMVVLDCASSDRINAGKRAMNQARKVVVIDHHETNTGFGDENYVDGNASSTCEFLTRFMDPDKIDLRMATLLYTGIIFDCGVFRYDCTGPETLRTAAMLIEKGVPFADIIRTSVTEKPWKVSRIQAAVTDRAVLKEKSRFLYSTADLALQNEHNVTTKDLGSIVADLNTIKGPDVTLFMYQFEDGTWKGSLRSKEIVNVSEIAAEFGGGGHQRAAGFSFVKDPEAVAEKIERKVYKLIHD